jgi:uncharacterized protein YeaO (DUF488 family)
MPDIQSIYDLDASGHLPRQGTCFFVEPTWPADLGAGHRVPARWLKALAPDEDLCRWFRDNPGDSREFLGRYRAQIKGRKCCEAAYLLWEVQKAMAAGPVVLAYADEGLGRRTAEALASLMQE